MARCEVCGNDYGQNFTVVMQGHEHPFDSFECAIQALAPTCSHCNCRIIGHGVQHGDTIYCCAHCARASGVDDLRDHS